MQYSSSFCTRSEIVRCNNLKPNGVSLIALDIGYSAVKGFSESSRFCFPSYTRRESGTLIGTPKDADIFYRDESGQVYAVGAVAQNSLSTRDTDDSTNTLFGRNRYGDGSFLILARVGMALAEPDPAKPIFLQTGLPPAYRKADTALLKETLSGHHKFSVKVGIREWTDCEFELPPENISVIDQPIGSVYSASKRADGTTVLCDDGKSYIDQRLLVLDGGFGTLDVFSISNRHIDSTNTFSNFGMKAIFEGVSKDIFERFGKEVHPHAMQRCLSDGYITVLDRKTHATRTEDISDILKDNTRKVFQQAMAKIEAAYDDLVDYDYLLVTGGTGAAWYNLLKARYQSMTTLHIIQGNQNEKMPPIYNNVRGYYIYRAVLLQK